MNSLPEFVTGGHGSLIGTEGELVSICIAVAIGALAGIWPAFQALRMRTVDALRRAG